MFFPGRIFVLVSFFLFFFFFPFPVAAFLFRYGPTASSFSPLLCESSKFFFCLNVLRPALRFGFTASLTVVCLPPFFLTACRSLVESPGNVLLPLPPKLVPSQTGFKDLFSFSFLTFDVETLGFSAPGNPCPCF